MPNKQLSDLPAEITEKLPEGAQNIFLAAFNSAQENGMSEQGAMDVAWNSVKQGYSQGEDGQWYKVPQDSNTHHKAVTSGGN